MAIRDYELYEGSFCALHSKANHSLINDSLNVEFRVGWTAQFWHELNDFW